jgi:integrase
VKDYLSAWLAVREGMDLAPGTRSLDRITVRVYLVPHIGNVRLQDLGTVHVSKLYATLGTTLKGKTVRNVHGTLRKALQDATKWKPLPLLASNPLADMKPPAPSDSLEREAWTAEEVRRFLTVAAEDRLGPIWRLALATGLRRGELLGLTWDDIDGASVVVRRQVLLPGPYVREMTKGRRTRTVRFDDATAVAVKAWKARQNEDRLAFGPN